MSIRILLFLLASTFFGFSQNAEIKPYADFLKNTEKLSAKDYILQQFQDHDIVIFCERDHSELSQYELIKEILSDAYFQKYVKNIFTETGVVNLQPKLTEFLKKRDLDSMYVEKKLNEFQQNLELYAAWERYNYHYFLRTIYDINNKSENQLSLYPSDSEFDWNRIETAADYKRAFEVEIEPRDSLIAYNMINKYEEIKTEDNKKALIILNYRHAFKIHSMAPNGKSTKNAGKYLSDHFGNRLVSILSNRPVFKRAGEKWSYTLIQDGKWDAAFRYLDMNNTGFDLDNSVFGNDIFDLENDKRPLKYKDVFDGFVFFKELEKHDLIDYYEGLVPKDFEAEFFRRLNLSLSYFENYPLLEKLKGKTFRASMLKEWNTSRHRKYTDFDFLIESRDRYLRE